MLYKFKSRASGDVIMTGPHGDELLRLIGKDPSPTGILTVDQMPAARAALEKAIELAEGRGEASEATADEFRDFNAVGLRQRVWPFLELIRYSLRDKVDIVWGV